MTHNAQYVKVERLRDLKDGLIDLVDYLDDLKCVFDEDFDYLYRCVSSFCEKLGGLVDEN